MQLRLLEAEMLTMVYNRVLPGRLHIVVYNATKREAVRCLFLPAAVSLELLEELGCTVLTGFCGYEGLQASS